MDALSEKKFQLVMVFRKINSYSEQDNFSTPSIEDILCMLGKAKFMSSFDISNSFYQTTVKKSDISKLAYGTHRPTVLRNEYANGTDQ